MEQSNKFCTSMSPPLSQLFTVKDIPGAGRGVVASKPIAKDTLVLRSEPPAAHVIFHQYRKEVCAQCFHYDCGRTLPVRSNSVRKVFCAPECEAEWFGNQGPLGRASWQQLQLFLQAKSKAMTYASGLPLLAPKPDIEEINAKWDAAEEVAKSLRRRRSTQSTKQVSTFQHLSSQPWAKTIEPDVLVFLLSGIFFHFQSPEKYDSTILPLAMDETPYKSPFDLETHINSFLQLTAIVPDEIQASVTSEVCRTLINAASHNSFGIRSGSEDMEEYMGYALYPEASYFNHSCTPNIAKKRDRNFWEFYGSRDIGVGEECCITYFGGDEEEMAVGVRRLRAREHWGFECMCARCVEESQA